jgi:hypothetical protein
MKIMRGLFLLALLLWGIVAWGAPPATISYQGYLKDSAGKPLTTELKVTFRLYGSLTGSDLLWEETQAVTPLNGVYRVELGTGAALDKLPFDRQYFLGVTVDADPELTPRQPLTAAPYAIRASVADAVATEGCINGDCRTSWNNQNSGSVNPMPRTCGAGQVAISTGPYSWKCGVICGFGTLDCNGSANDGCETAIATDANNCGGCGVACSGNNIASRTCSNFTCNGACNAGFADCDTNKLSNGCEINIGTDPNNCGACGTVCSANNMASRSCGGGVCNGACAAGFADCNINKQVDGCETGVSNDPNNCGGCGFICSNLNMASRTCGSGVCNGTCNAGYADCNGNKLADGCETNTMNSNSNCGACGNVCSGSTRCLNGICIPILILQ